MNETTTPDNRTTEESSPSNQDGTSNNLPLFKNKHLEVIDKLGDSKFPTFVVQKSGDNKLFALKLFRQRNSKTVRAYINESRFMSLRHDNIIRIVGRVNEEEISVNAKPVMASYILMELAICDFDDLFTHLEMNGDEVLARTYFHQLIEGIEYLQKYKIAHLDLKVQNLLLGNDFKLKISDFDLAFVSGDTTYFGKGTTNFRAPEIIEANYSYLGAADIFSAGVILFIMRLGFMPYYEQKETSGINLFNILMNNPEKFWHTIGDFEAESKKVSDDFKALFLSMVEKDPLKRASLDSIKKSSWYLGEIYDDKKLQSLMRNKIRR